MTADTIASPPTASSLVRFRHTRAHAGSLEPIGVASVDDATESVHGVQIRERETPHGGADPRASDRPPKTQDR